MENWGAAELRALFGGSADVAERQIMAGGQKLDVPFQMQEAPNVT